MSPDSIKLFALSHQMVERELDRLESKLGLDLGRDLRGDQDKDEEYYPQFEEAVRKEASQMAAHYEVFYCLEKSIRALIREKLQAEKGTNWWETSVPEEIRGNAQKNMQREIDSGVTPRSTEEIDYTTFGELGEIVRKNWPTFGDTFNSEKAFTKVMTSLNVLRGPIGHCCPFAPDEVMRLQLTVKDWFRLME